MQNNIVIILVSPQMGENIGAAARVMKNFGFKNLRIVEPRDSWPNAKAENMAVGAVNLLKSAKIFPSLPASLEDIHYSYATAATHRNINKPQISSADLAKEPILHRFLKNCDVTSNEDNDPAIKTTTIKTTTIKIKIAVIFGRENSGLTNLEISYANKILTIDTVPEFYSLNLAQAVAIICYELLKFWQQMNKEIVRVSPFSTLDKKDQLASNGELQYFFQNLFILLEDRQFFRTAEKKNYMVQKIKNMYNRINNLTKSELQILQGMVTALAKNKIK